MRRIPSIEYLIVYTANGRVKFLRDVEAVNNKKEFKEVDFSSIPDNKKSLPFSLVESDDSKIDLLLEIKKKKGLRKL